MNIKNIMDSTVVIKCVIFVQNKCFSRKLIETALQTSGLNYHHVCWCIGSNPRCRARGKHPCTIKYTLITHILVIWEVAWSLLVGW